MKTPFVTVYEFDEEQAKRLKLRMKIFNSQPTEAWARFVLENRHASRTGFTHNYDIVIGPVANDTVATQLRLFEMEYITMRQLVKRLSFPLQNSQHFFKTEKAIQLLKKIDVIKL